MKKKMMVLLFVLGAAVTALAAWPLHCKYDNASLFWKGKTRVVYGQMEYLCTCGMNHYYWLSKADCSE